MLMSNGIKQVEFLVGDIFYHRWMVTQKLAMIGKSFAEGESVSSVARRHGVAPNLLYRWRRCCKTAENLQLAVTAMVLACQRCVDWKNRLGNWNACLVVKCSRMRFLKRLLSVFSQKTDLAAELLAQRRFSMSGVATTLDVWRSNQHECAKGSKHPRGRYKKAEDAVFLPMICHLVGERPTYGYRRIAALVNGKRLAEGLPVINLKQIYRIISNH